MLLRHTLFLALAALTTAACSRAADRGAVGPAQMTPATAASVTATIEDAGGIALPTYFHLGEMFVEGQSGQAYAIRLTNNSAARVEVIVTVDGRDVVSGQLGNFKKQRGYVIEPFATIRIDGFRQSLDHVAQFRFSDVEASYSARQGTPQHAGVIGFAVFYEKPRRQKKTGPIAVGPAPAETASPEPFPGSGGRASAKSRAPAQTATPVDDVEAEADMAAPEAGAADEAPASARAEAAPGGGDGFAPPPEPVNELGTEYGETRVSSVHEVQFKRRRQRKPDELFAIRYDSAAGLQRRGVPIDGNGPLIAAPPDAFPGAR